MTILRIIPFIPAYLGYTQEEPIQGGILPRAYEIIQYKNKWWRVDLVAWPADRSEVYIYLNQMHASPAHITDYILQTSGIQVEGSKTK